MKRSEARELAFKTVYSKFFNADQDLSVDIDSLDKDSLEFISEILSNFASYYDDINEIIGSNLKGYTVERLYKVDLAILIVAIVELKFIKKTAKEIIINEAVELAKKYSTDKSPKFINGVLADIVKDLK